MVTSHKPQEGRLIKLVSNLTVIILVSSGVGGGGAATVTVTLALLVAPLESNIVYVKESSPENPLAGVYVKTPSLREITAPPVDPLCPDTVVGSSPKESLAMTSIMTEVPYDVDAESFIAIGTGADGAEKPF